MEKKMKTPVTAYAIGAGFFYILGFKHGQNSVKRKIVKEWRKVNFGPDIDFPLFYPKVFEKEVVHFFDVIGSQLKVKEGK